MKRYAHIFLALLLSSMLSITFAVNAFADGGIVLAQVQKQKPQPGITRSAITKTNAPTIPVGSAPVNSSLPTVSGTPGRGQTLTAANGTWTNSPTGYTNQWRRCDSSGNGCSDIAGATSSTYQVQAADVGSTIRVVVTAANASGSGAPATSAQTALVGTPPVNTGSSFSLPTISGTARAGETLTASTGPWTQSPTSYSYQWRICDSTGSGCLDAGANASTFSLAIRDIVGATIRVVVTARNAYGSGSATSVQTAVVVSGAPINTVLPTITGWPGVGQTLTASNGSWNPAATLPYSYQWRRCDSAGNNCASISGASPTSGTYTVQAADVGSTIRVIVSAYNAYGLGNATSAKTAIIAVPPANTALPSISGTTTVGQLLSASNGSWSSVIPITYSYHWRRCDSSGSSCVDTGMGGANYLLQAADYQHTIRVVVTASSAYGPGAPGPGAPATSAQTAVVAALR